MFFKVYKNQIPELEININLQKKLIGVDSLFSWCNIINKTSNFDYYIICAIDESEIIGFINFTYVKSRLLGSRLVSQGYSNYGGLNVENYSKETIDGFLLHINKLSKDLNCNVEIRSLDLLDFDNYQVNTDKISFWLDISDTQVTYKNVEYNVRKQINKAKRNNVTVKFGRNELLSEFHTLYSKRMWQLGTPAYSKNFFKNILDLYPENSVIGIAYHNDCAIASLFCTYLNDFAQCPWGAQDLKYSHLSPNYLLYWSAIEFFASQGCKTFDFGRSTVNGAHHFFKKQWDSKTIQLYYLHYSKNNKVIIKRPDKGIFKYLTKIWKSIPFSVSLIISKYVSKYFV